MTLEQLYLECSGSLAEAVSRLGSERLILRFISRLPSDNSLTELTAGLEDGDIQRVFRAAHTLKGIALNLGLLSLFRSADTVAEALRGSSDPALLSSISGAIGELVFEVGRVNRLIATLEL